jgi:hypothetical protein
MGFGIATKRLRGMTTTSDMAIGRLQLVERPCIITHIFLANYNVYWKYSQYVNIIQTKHVKYVIHPGLSAQPPRESRTVKADNENTN